MHNMENQNMESRISKRQSVESKSQNIERKLSKEQIIVKWQGHASKIREKEHFGIHGGRTGAPPQFSFASRCAAESYHRWPLQASPPTANL